MQQQLGLKLVEQTAPVNVLVIDHVEQPTDTATALSQSLALGSDSARELESAQSAADERSDNNTGQAKLAYRMGRLVIRSADPSKALTASREDFNAVFPMKKGDIFDQSKVQKSADDFASLYRQRGYTGFTATPTLDFHSDTKTVDVTFDFAWKDTPSQAGVDQIPSDNDDVEAVRTVYNGLKDAFLRKDIDTMMSMMTSDVTFAGAPGEPLIGREKVKALYKRLWAEFNVDMGTTSATDFNIHVEKDVATVTANLNVTIVPVAEGPSTVLRGQVSYVFRKEDRQWKLAGGSWKSVDNTTILLSPRQTITVEKNVAHAVWPISHAIGGVEMLTPTQGVNFDGYLQRAIENVKVNWYGAMPASVQNGKQGRAAVQCRILRDGSVQNVQLTASSEKNDLDRAALSSISTVAHSFDPLPTAFTGPYIELRFTFFYNTTPSD